MGAAAKEVAAAVAAATAAVTAVTDGGISAKVCRMCLFVLYVLCA